MSSSNGVTYYSKSMNGLVTFETGSGLVLEGDTITADTITCSTLNTDNFSVAILDVTTLNATTLNADYAIVLNNTTAENFIANDGLFGVNTTTDNLIVNDETTLQW